MAKPYVKWVNQKLRQHLGRLRSTSVEVALELWLALTASSQARWLQLSKSAAAALLQVGPGGVFYLLPGWWGGGAFCKEEGVIGYGEGEGCI